MALKDELQKNPQKEFRWVRVFLLAGIGFGIILIWAFADFGSATNYITSRTNKVNASAGYECPETLAILATTSRPCTVTISNRDDKPLTEVVLTINGEYTFKVGSPGINGHKNYSTDLENFVNEDGSRFNFVSTRILSVSLRSEQGSADWTFQ